MQDKDVVAKKRIPLALVVRYTFLLRFVRLFILTISTVVAGCAGTDDSATSKNELVMRPGDVIEAAGANGVIRVESLGELKRRYVWGDVDRTLDLWPRKTRWNGALGAYYGAFGPFSDTNASESSLDFNSDADLKAFLNARQFAIVSNQGIGVSFGLAYNGNNYVEIVKLCVKHKIAHLQPAPYTSFVWQHSSDASVTHAWFGCSRTIYRAPQ